MSDKPVILIVDDDKNTRDGLQRALQRHYTIKTAESAEVALAILGNETTVDVMLSDLRMPGTDGLGLLRRVNAQHPQTVCILLTAYGSVETAVEAMKQGAYDFLTKPINLDHLDMLVARALKSRDLEKKVETLESQLNEKFGMENIIGESDAMKQVFEVIRQTAPTQASVLIQGPSGTGKELVAQSIHRLSTRAKGPFVAVHCAALSATLLESELFGHEKGAFTGATVQRKGRFELADGGTLFLDEVSEIDPSIQVKLLRVLEERTFERVGGEETIETDIRVIAATNRDLRDYVRQGRFREDLFYRLNVIEIKMPPLRERKSDIRALAQHFLEKYCREMGKEITKISSYAIDLLQKYDFPGNVRELENLMERSVAISNTNILLPDSLALTLHKRRWIEGVGDKRFDLNDVPKGVVLEEILDQIERAYIEKAMESAGGNKKKAAELLGLRYRSLWHRIDKMGGDL